MWIRQLQLRPGHLPQNMIGIAPLSLPHGYLVENLLDTDPDDKDDMQPHHVNTVLVYFVLTTLLVALLAIIGLLVQPPLHRLKGHTLIQTSSSLIVLGAVDPLVQADFAMSCSSREIDHEYLASLEKKLNELKSPTGRRATAKEFLSDLASHKDHQLFQLITGNISGFEDNFIDEPIQPNYLQRKIAPQTCAINKQEQLKLVKNDLIQKIRNEVEGISEEEIKAEEKLEKERKKQLDCEQLKEASDNHKTLHSIVPNLRRGQATEHNSSDEENIPRGWRHWTTFPIKNAYFMVKLQFPGHFPHSFMYVINVDGDCYCVDQFMSTQLYIRQNLKLKLRPLDVLEFTGGDGISSNCGTFLATCWVIQNVHVRPLHRFIALYKLTGPRNISYLAKIAFPETIAVCNFFEPVDGKILLATYPMEQDIRFFEIDTNTRDRVRRLEKEEWRESFPELDFGIEIGTIIRRSRTANDHYAFSLCSYDTGSLIISVANKKTKKLIKKIKVQYSAIGTIAKFFDDAHPTKHLAKCVLSSSLGPATICHCVVRSDTDVEWITYAVLEGSNRADTLTNVIIGEHEIILGTHADSIAVYPKPIVHHHRCSKSPMLNPTFVGAGAPVFNLCFLYPDMLAALTASGVSVFVVDKWRDHTRYPDRTDGTVPLRRTVSFDEKRYVFPDAPDRPAPRVCPHSVPKVGIRSYSSDGRTRRKQK